MSLSRRRSKIPVLWLIPIVVTSLLAGGCATIAFRTAELGNTGLWLRGFVQSPGAVAIAALLAAIVALGGLFHQRDTARRDAWWSTFEWASSRAIPKDRKEQPLPNDVVIVTLRKLADEAKSPLEESACSGVITALTRHMPKPTPQPSPPGPSANVPTERTDAGMQALAEYVADNVDTAAASPVAEALVYEHDVMAALASLAPGVKVFRNPPDAGADAVAEIDGVLVAIEIKRHGSPAAAYRAIPAVLDRLRANSIADAFVVITPYPMHLSPQRRAEFGTSVLPWRDEKDTPALLHGLRRAAEIGAQHQPESTRRS
ncbi:hypothetical protein [Plantibacter flavus]|uniref:hypothetical protein n=1 Tax=Plantibacter flavus TaxID=150123 RepID=UPI00339A6B99